MNGDIRCRANLHVTQQADSGAAPSAGAITDDQIARNCRYTPAAFKLREPSATVVAPE